MQPRQFSVPSFSSIFKGYRRATAAVANQIPQLLTKALLAQAIVEPITQRVTFGCPSTETIQDRLTNYFNDWTPPLHCNTYYFKVDLHYPIDRNLLDDRNGYLQFEPRPQDCNTAPIVTLASDAPAMSVMNLPAHHSVGPGHPAGLAACVYNISYANMPIHNYCLFNPSSNPAPRCYLLPISNTQFQLGSALIDGSCELENSQFHCNITKTPNFMFGTWISSNPYLRLTYSNLNNTVSFDTDVLFPTNNAYTACRSRFVGNATDDTFNTLFIQYSKQNGVLLQKTPDCQSLFNNWLNGNNSIPYVIISPGMDELDLFLDYLNEMSFTTVYINGTSINVSLDRERPLALSSSSSSTGATWMSSSTSSAVTSHKRSSSSTSITSLLSALSSRSTIAHSVSSSTASSSSAGAKAGVDQSNSDASSFEKVALGAGIALGAGLVVFGLYRIKARRDAGRGHEIPQVSYAQLTPLSMN